MEWVSVRHTNGATEAELLKNMLESFGIPAIIRFESAGKLFGITSDGLGSAEILVPEDRAEEAREILSKHSQAET